jgi:site-specific DNA-methyltransferase (adenine-specific)
MTLYYEADGVTIYHGDCREIVPTLTADVLITDPPYGVALKAKRARNKGGGSHEVNRASTLYEDDPDRTGELIRESIPAALAAANGRGLIFSGTRMLFSYPLPVVIGAVYMPAGSGYTSWGFQNSQPILYYGSDPYLADGNGHRPNGFLHHPDDSTSGIDHPCPKPLSWMTWAVNRASRPGETILDPFAGSGTTLVAAKQDQRKAIGVEKEERYCEIAARRLSQGVLDLGATA